MYYSSKGVRVFKMCCSLDLRAVIAEGCRCSLYWGNRGNVYFFGILSISERCSPSDGRRFADVCIRRTSEVVLTTRGDTVLATRLATTSHNVVTKTTIHTCYNKMHSLAYQLKRLPIPSLFIIPN